MVGQLQNSLNKLLLAEPPPFDDAELRHVDSTSTSFEVAAFFLLAAGRLGATFGVCAWLVEADGEGVCAWLVEVDVEGVCAWLVEAVGEG